MLTAGNTGCRKHGLVDYPLGRRASVKDAVEALGVPHTEVGGIMVDGRSVDFRHLLQDDEQVAVTALSPPVDVTCPGRLRPKPLERLAFVCDVNVGRLARSLRVLGLDTLYDTSWKDAEVAAVAVDQGRVVLSKDRGLLKRSAIVHGRLVRHEDPKAQLVEVLRHYGLDSAPESLAPFSRCPVCNGVLEPVPKAEVLHLLEPLTRRYYQDFSRCTDCGKVYWPGSHHERLKNCVDTRLAPRLTRGPEDGQGTL